MTDSSFRPVIYFKEGCPFCFKIRLFLLEAGLLDAVTIRQFAPGTGQETAIRATLDGKLEKVTFPAAEIEAGMYLSDSDAIAARLASTAGVDAASLETYQEYVRGPLKTIANLFNENMALKRSS